MAAVTKVHPILVSPPGYEVVLRGRASVDLNRGDPVVIDDNATIDSRFDTAFTLAASEPFIHGVVLKDTKAGQAVEVLDNGEMDGFAGMTPKTPLYAEEGAIGTVAPTVTYEFEVDEEPGEVEIPAAPQMWAISATRIRVRV